MLQVPWRRAPLGTSLSLLCVLLTASCASDSSGSGGPDGVTKQEQLTGAPDPAELAMSASQQKLDRGDPEGALGVLDEYTSASRTWPTSERYSFELLRGKANLALVRVRQSRGQGGTTTRAAIEDAKLAFASASELDAESPAPHVGCAEALRMQGDWRGIEEATSKAVQLLGGLENADGEAGIRSLELRAEARLRQILAERQQDADEISEALRSQAQQALVDCSRIEKVAPTRPSSYVLGAQLCRAVGQAGKALDILKRGVRNAPGEKDVHVWLQSLYHSASAHRACVGFYANFANEHPTGSAMVSWFQGEAELAYADELRRNSAIESAHRRYELAAKAYERCLQLEPEYRNWSRFKQAIALLSQARMSIDDGLVAPGEEALDAAYERSPAIAAMDENGYMRWRDGLGKDYRGAIVALGRRFSGTGGAALEDACRFWRKITQRHGNWGFAWNNLGFACRDLGVRYEKEGDGKKAMKLWEESYAAYENAVEHSPEDARIANDCGLMLLYHLGRDHARAQRLFEKAIALGSASLEALGEKADDEEKEIADKRRDLEESVGDAWENLAKLFWEQQKDARKARAALERSIEYFPYEKGRDGVRQIRASMQAAADDSEKQGRVAHPQQTILALLTARPVLREEDVAERAAALLASGDLEKALNLLDEWIPKRKDDVELWYLGGRATLQWARRLIEQKSGKPQLYLVDAVDRLERADQLARKLEGGSPRYGADIHVLPVIDAIDAEILLGKADAASQRGSRQATHLDSLGLRFTPAVLARFQTRRAEAAARSAIAAKSKGTEGADDAIASARDVLTRARAALEKLGKPPLDWESLAKKARGSFGIASFVTAWKDMELWAQKPAAAVRVLGQGAVLVEESATDPLLSALSQLVKSNEGLGESAIEWTEKALRAHGGGPRIRWWLGYVHYSAALAARKASRNDDAIRECKASLQAYEKVLDQSAEFARGTKYAMAQTHTSLGTILHATGKKEEGREHWKKSIALWPDKNNPRDELSNRTARDELFIHAMDHSKRDMLEAASQLEELGASLSDDWEAFNNAALLLRDYCESRGARRNPQGAMKTLERSYANYRKAIAIQPDDARLSNDTALIDVYYLKKHSTESEQMLSRGIRVGTQRLKENPPENSRELRDLKEAVGDCHMNLGLLLLGQPARWDEAEKHLRKSFEYWPGQRRASRGMLARLERMRTEAAEKKAAEKKAAEEKEAAEKKKEGDGGGESGK